MFPFGTRSVSLCASKARVSVSAALAAPRVIGARLCSSSSSASSPTDGPTIAPKKSRRRIVPTLDASEMIRSVPTEPGAHAELSTAELERKLEEMSRLNPKQLEEVMKKFDAQEDASSRVLEEDSLYQMDVSLKTRSQGAARVFWKDVDVQAMEEYPGWYCVTIDGRKVKAFESSQVLAVPSEALAYCCAREYAEQSGYVNKLLMPLSDLCSGALHVAPQMIAPRIDYLMSFYQNDNLYFRSAGIAKEQDALIAPIAEWFEGMFHQKVPRVVGIAHPNITPEATAHVRDALLAMSMNPYQVVALCVTAQYTSSLLLPLALFHGVVDLPTALKINRAEEYHNVEQAGLVEGYHDIREADVVTKICACASAWQLVKDVPLSKCLEVPRVTPMEEAESV